MKSLSLLLLVAGCDQVFSLDRAFDAAPDSPTDAPPDAPDAAIDAPPPCVLPTGNPSSTFGTIPGTTYRDFAVTEDEQLALLTQAPLVAEYTEAPLGMSIEPTGLQGTWGRVALSPEGDVAFLSDASSMIYMSRYTGSVWSSVDTVTGLPIGLPGRPSLDTQRMVIQRNVGLQEYERSSDSWAPIGPLYSGATLGHGNSQLTAPNLTADGRFLVYVIPGTGAFIRQRKADGTFGTAADGGRLLVPGDVRTAVLVHCTRLYLVPVLPSQVAIYEFGQ